MLQESLSNKKKFILTEEDIYISPKRKNIFISSTIRFLLPFIDVVVSGGLLAKRGCYDDRQWVKSSYKILYSLEKAGVKFEITGLKNISSFEGPAVFISNHMSTLETSVLPVLIQPVKNVTFVVKQELLNLPFYGKLLQSRNPIVVGRSNPREDFIHVMNEGEKILKKGKSIIIFPQKTRSKVFNPETFNTLGIKLAKKAGCYVVPIALITDAWANGKIIKDFGKIDPSKKVYISFGKPFKVESNGSKEHQTVLDFIKSKLIEWQRPDCYN